MMGMGALLPWNFFITAESYWQYKFRNVSLDNTTISPDVPFKTDLQFLYTPLQVVFSQIPNFIFLFLNSVFSDKIPQRIRLIGSLSLLITFFTVTTIFTQINTDDWQVKFFGVNMVVIFFVNVAGAIWQGGIFGLAGMFPGKFMTATMTGMGISGVFAAVARIVSLAAGADPVECAFIYFLIAVVFMILTLVVYLLLTKMDYYKHYSTYEKIEEISIEQFSGENTGVISNYIHVFKKIWKLALNVCFVYVVTLSIYPVIGVKIISSTTNPVWAKKYFQPVSTFLLFNVGDLIGRQTAGIWAWPRNNSKTLYIITFLRIFFIPLFLGCNNDYKSIYSYFHHDSIYMILMILFSVSNGHLTSLCMIYGPSSVSGLETEKAGAIMAASLGLGLLLGGIISFGFGSIQ
ncbi:unnamed protein product [Meganyctiphanes norvegica]|uniref:Equilibrative nucleoside transporter 1 n=1 Tax=Meganyctiphanes norvegica TaxID=48144 RepID=A0AAV2PQ35_MEGNR